MRCANCGKVCFESHRAAHRAKENIRRPLSVYFSAECGWFHLTSKHTATKARKRRKPRKGNRHVRHGR